MVFGATVNLWNQLRHLRFFPVKTQPFLLAAFLIGRVRGIRLLSPTTAAQLSAAGRSLYRMTLSGRIRPTQPGQIAMSVSRFLQLELTRSLEAFRPWIQQARWTAFWWMACPCFPRLSVTRVMGTPAIRQTHAHRFQS